MKWFELSLPERPEAGPAITAGIWFGVQDTRTTQYRTNTPRPAFRASCK